MISGVTEITEICTKQDMSRWTRAHVDTPGITWSVVAGPGGTMIIVEHEEDRASQGAAHAVPEPVTVPAGLTEGSDGASVKVASSFARKPSRSAPTFA